MVFTKEDGIQINVLRQSKGYSARKLLEKFADKDWSCSALDQLLPRGYLILIRFVTVIVISILASLF